jgi:hypothetical protein
MTGKYHIFSIGLRQVEQLEPERSVGDATIDWVACGLADKLVIDKLGDSRMVIMDVDFFERIRGAKAQGASGAELAQVAATAFPWLSRQRSERINIWQGRRCIIIPIGGSMHFSLVIIDCKHSSGVPHMYHFDSLVDGKFADHHPATLYETLKEVSTHLWDVCVCGVGGAQAATSVRPDFSKMAW